MDEGFNGHGGEREKWRATHRLLIKKQIDVALPDPPVRM